jgi:hypothetical protein
MAIDSFNISTFKSKNIKKNNNNKKNIYFLIYTSFDIRAILHEFKVKYNSNYYNK